MVSFGAEDPSSWILPLIAFIVIPFTMLVINRYSRAEWGTTITGTIEVKGLQGSLADLKNEMARQSERLERLIEKRDIEHKENFNRAWTRIEQISAKQLVHEYRLDDMDHGR